MQNKLNYKKYSEYKDSGVEWLGEIPKHWDATKVKNVFKLIIDPAPKNNNFELLSVYTDIGVKPRQELEERGNKASTTDGYWFVKKGDIVVNKLLAWMGAIGVSNYDGVTSPAYDILRNKVQLDCNFYHYLFRNEACVSELKRHSRGIMDMRLRLYFDKFGDIVIPFPNFEEQQKIVNFLDCKTGLIDQAIDIKKKQIELLKERRQILIHKAVTKGLNPDVKMKDSGVDWIGEIPDGWEVIKLKYLSTFINDGTHGSYSRVEDGYRLLSVRNMVDDKFVFREDDSRVSEKHFKEIYSKFQIKRGDINLAIVGATLGKVAIVDEYDELFVTQRSVCTIRVKEELLLNSFLFYSIKSPYFQSYLWNNAGFSAQPGVYLGTIQSSVLSLPKIDEQIIIVDFLNETCQKYDTAIALKEQEIEKLKEYKSVLINEAVTGKVRVC